MENIEKDSGKTMQQQFLLSLKDLQERAYNLRLFDKRAQIGAHCDELFCDVMTTVESAMRHLENVRDHLLKQIAQYHLNTLTCDDEKDVAMKERIQALTSKAAEFADDWTSYLGEYQVCDEMIQIGKEQAAELDVELKELKSEARKQAFQGRFMQFKADGLFGLGLSTLGVMETSNKDPETKTAAGPRISELLEVKYLDADYLPTDVVFLPNGDVMTCQKSCFIRMWNGKSGELIKKLPFYVTTMACFRSKYLYIGDEKGLIQMIDIDSHEVVRSLQAHENYVAGLVVLPDDSLVSCCFGGRLNIWRPNSTKPAFSHFHDSTSYTHNKPSTLSNGNVVHCFTNFDGSAIKVFDPRRLLLEMELPIDMCRVKALCVLSNDHVAISAGKEVKVYDLVQRVQTRRFEMDTGEAEISCLLAFPNGFLLAAANRMCINREYYYIWDTKNGELVSFKETWICTTFLRTSQLNEDNTVRFVGFGYNSTPLFWDMSLSI